jgi:hypothetical protein
VGNVFDLDKFKSKRPALPAARKARKQAVEPFVQVPLEWIERAARLTRSPVTLVLMELLYASWRAKSATFPLPNARLKQLGVSRNVKRRALLDLECGRLITVRRPPRKTPVVTLRGV